MFLGKKGEDFDVNNFCHPINNEAILGAYLFVFLISCEIDSERENGTVRDIVVRDGIEAVFAIK